MISGGRSHWKAQGPLGASPEWDAEITLDEPGGAIGWRSIEGSPIKTAGRVNYQREGDGTRVEVTIEYDAPAGAADDVVAKVFSNPERQVRDDLARFKELIEAGQDSRLPGPAAD